MNTLMSHSAGYAAIIAILAYALTRFSVGERADQYPAGAIIPAFFLSPWLLALCGGLAAHVVAVVVMRLIKRKAVSRNLRITLALAAFGVSFSFMLAVNAAVGDSLALINASDTQAWARVSHSEPGAYVAENYRPCVDATAYRTVALGLHVLAQPVRKNDPLACASAAVAMARQQKGDAFANQVEDVIARLPQSLALSSEAIASLDRLQR